MDDPWAAPSWSTPAKPSSSVPSLESGPPRDDPAPSFGGDPWGAPSAGSGAPATAEEGAGALSEVQLPAKEEKKAELPSWGGDDEPWGADESATPALPTSPPPQPQTKASPDHGAVWDLNSPPAPPMPDPPSPPPITTTIGPADTLAAAVPLPTTPVLSTPPTLSTPQFTTPTRYHTLSPSIHSPFSPHSIHSSHTPARNSLDAGGFGADMELPSVIPKSPSFGDEFGGFSGFGGGGTTGGDDPWGSGAGGGQARATGDGGDGWGGSDWGDTSFPKSASGILAGVEEREEEVEEEKGVEEEGWGGASRGAGLGLGAARVEDKGDTEWEEAQRRIRIQEERAPKVKIDAMTKQWTDLAADLMADGVELEKMTGAEELKYEQTVNKVFEDAAERLRSLSTIPPDVNTYPPNVNSLVTHERYAYALQRPNPDPSSSLLSAAARSSRRPRRIDPLSLTLSSDSEPSWSTRSRLGEPDASGGKDAPASAQEEGKGRWSFWGRRPAPERQLTTSGGGILEVKAISPTGTGGTPTSETRPSTETKAPSIAPSRPPSIVGSVSGLSVAPGSSRPASPAPAPSVPASIIEDPGHATPSAQVPGASAPAAPAAPSAVSRFFGRISRRQSQLPAASAEVDAKDLELSADDFSFLAEVPSMSQPPPEKGVGDLLAMEPNRPEQMASLESLLNSKAAPLPKAFAPPPKAGPGAGGRTASGKFVARMKAPAPTDMDLLGDLDFASPTSPAASASAPGQLAAQATGASSSSAWDDFLSMGSSTPPVKPQASGSPLTASPAGGIPPPLNSSRSGTPVISLSPPPSATTPAPTTTTPLAFSSLATPAKPKPALAPVSTSHDFGDFDDFASAAPQAAASGGGDIDDFGDFSDFSTFDAPAPPPARAPIPVPKPQPVSHSISASSSSSSLSHRRPSSLDHTPTLNLVAGASASKGKRWPAPPSPVPEALSPPPRASGAGGMASSGGFPFLSPPPPGPGPRARASNDLLGGAGAGEELGGSVSMSTGSGSGSGMGGGVGAGLLPSAPGPAKTPSPQTFGAALAPVSLSGSPMASPAKATGVGVGAGAGGAAGLGTAGAGKGGLSAQDLSFFDSL
ncbi:hypothetical protein IAT38_007086 [Cryptococcus sp. DSM 104549]